ncbi:hemerythrin domain-containing protein [Candidatus Neomarinimicrobiota bacterium]
MTVRAERSHPLFSGGEEILQTLPEGHVIHTLVREHRRILDILLEIDALRASLKLKGSLEESESILRDIAQHAEMLLDAENHHLREEQVVCLEMERRGLSGPPEIMRQEHNLLRPIKRHLLDLATTGAEKKEFGVLQADIDETTDRIIANLILHTQKEDKVLYPMALKIIDDQETWQHMRQKCDEIGYCSFTPVSGK